MKKITLVCFGNSSHKTMKFAIENTLMNTPEIEDVIVFSNSAVLNYGKFVQISDNFSLKDYNYFMIKNLWAHVRTEFVMICQHDGIAKKEFWDDEYLKYDYIGAVWPTRFNWIAESQRVGNGGFSIRSLKLLNILRDNDIVFDNDSRYQNEDALISQRHSEYLKTKYSIKYAPISLADKFSHEWNNPTGNTFGFHGLWNIPLFFDENICKQHISTDSLDYWLSDKLFAFRENCIKVNYISLFNEFIDQLQQNKGD